MRFYKLLSYSVSWLILALLITSLAHADISRPIDNENNPTKVKVKIFLIDIDDVDGASQSFEANVYYELRWNDPRLINKNGGVQSRSLADIWNPRVQIINQQRVWKSFQDVAEVSPSGDVIYRQRVWGNFSQPLELNDFPFDQQIFEINLGTVGHYSDEIELVVDPGSEISKKFSLPDWDVINWDVKVGSKQIFSNKKPHDMVTLSFKAHRRAGYFIGKVIIPLILVVAMSWAVFWIDPKASGTMVSVAITAMLTLIAYRFAVGANLPKVDYMTRLDLFILCSSIMVFTSLVQVMITSHFANSDRLTLARNIDLWCRWLFPTIFVLIALETLVLRLVL